MAQIDLIPKLTQDDARRCRRILEFWHTVEFFLPFDLGQVTEVSVTDAWSVRQFGQESLRAIGELLWHNWDPPDGKRVSHFDLYLGVFDKSRLTDIVQGVVKERLSEEERAEQDERTDLEAEGPTCCARMHVDALGKPEFDTLSVSTVPWALGRIQQAGLEGLAFDAFQEGLEVLKENLRNFSARRGHRPSGAQSNDSSPGNSVSPMTGLEVLELLEIFYAWAAFWPTPSDRAVIVIRAVPEKVRSSSSTDRTAGEASPESEEEDEPVAPSAEIDILNSFYAKDIERAIRALDRDEIINPCLHAYLKPLAEEERVDLYTDEGRERILRDLHPKKLTSGHWLCDPAHAMSLMQQLAINNVFDAPRQKVLFSVNGPPGTGKTTLLRDIFAENIIRRAGVLAGFNLASDAFLPEKRQVSFEGREKIWRVGVLRPELTGFEMVVASSNNKAVENISLELPRMTSLGAADPGNPWRPAPAEAKQTYLKPVAHRIAAQEKKNGAFKNLEPDETPWGLVSCALGNRTNRRAFAERLASRCCWPGEDPPKGYNPELHQSILEWCDGYEGPSFAAARKAFQAADRKMTERRNKLARYALLVDELRGCTADSYAEEETRAVTQAEKAHREVLKALDDMDGELRSLEAKLADLGRDEKLIAQLGPPWWKRMLSGEARREHRRELDANRKAQRIHLERKRKIEDQRCESEALLQEASTALDRARRALVARRKAWESTKKELDELGPQFPEATRPETPCALEPDQENAGRWQIQGVWQDRALDLLRSELFATALALHQAWLGEVLKAGAGFRPNVVALDRLLSGTWLSDPKDALPIWQSLFMIVPVISSTFASIGDQFRDLGMAALGWLFIDEAGQAVPQAAVGALWRARRAVVVGDPLQIEPVFSVPFKLIEKLHREAELPMDLRVEPHRASAQNLADVANEIGTKVASGWIGSPLRVHRRCVEPMFGIANRIAYDGKMVYGSKDPPDKGSGWGDSAWVNVPGATSDKQVVRAQIDLVIQAVVAHVHANSALPAVYIISPFKRIKRALIEDLRAALAPMAKRRSDGRQGARPDTRGAALSKSDVDRLLEEGVGTVHTFQGKEESMVWMVLGCDKRTEGAIVWASAKPNLLNVAVTRAQHRLFIIGDVDLWGGRLHFKSALGCMPPISGEQFLRRAAARSSASVCASSHGAGRSSPSP